MVRRMEEVGIGVIFGWVVYERVGRGLILNCYSPATLFIIAFSAYSIYTPTIVFGSP